MNSQFQPVATAHALSLVLSPPAPEVTLTYRAQRPLSPALWQEDDHSTGLSGWMNSVLCLSDSKTPTLTGSTCHQSPAKWKHFYGGGLCRAPPSTSVHFRLSVKPVPTSSSSSASLPCPALPPHRLLSTRFLNTDTHADPADHVEEGSGGFRKNKLPFLTFNTTPPRCCFSKGGRRRKEKRKQNGDGTQGQRLTIGFIVEVQGFHYQSVGPLRKTRKDC